MFTKCKSAQRIFVCSLLGLLVTGVDAAENAAQKSKTTQDKFSGQFWNAGKHFQLDGEAVIIAEDGIHDPTNITALYGLQTPVEAMEEFPRDQAGLTDWVQALRQGHIEPRSDFMGNETPLQPFDLDIVFAKTGSMPHVLFSHKAHTEWLVCDNCHPAIFKPQKGANDFRMQDVLSGQYCGVCHGKVAFAPPRNCMRCHAIENKTPLGKK